MEELEANTVLFKLAESPSFTLATCISHLISNASNIGVFSYLCEKIKTFPYEEIEFYVPQLCQILVTIETESMALEDLVIELSTLHPHFTLLAFWQLQSHLSDLADDFECYGFQVARRVLNSLQYLIFNTGSPNTKFRENTNPAIILSSAIAASFAIPQLGNYIAPLAISQGKKQRSFVFQLAKNYSTQLAKNLTLKNTKLNSRRDTSNNSTNNKYDTIASPTLDDKFFKKEHPKDKDEDVEDTYKPYENIMKNTNILERKKSIKSSKLTANALKLYPSQSVDNNDYDLSVSRLNFDHSTSLPDFRDTVSEGGISLRSEGISIPSSPSSSIGFDRSVSATEGQLSRTNSLGAPVETRGRSSYKTHHHHYPSRRTISPSLLTTATKIKLLKSNYFKCETQFAIALQQVSMRLSQVPKEARLTTLKAELSLMNRDLPAEVDIPTLLPPSKKLKLHKLVRITPNEAAVLNSAEKVPFLLLIEYLSNEVDFDPVNENNLKLLRERSDKKYIFDMGTQTATRLISASTKDYNNNNSPSTPVDSGTSMSPLFGDDNLDEEDLGDLSVIKLSNKNDTDNLKKTIFINNASVIPNLDDASIEESNTRRGSNLNFSGYKSPNLDSNNINDDKVEPEDLATHMRIAAVMLTQLDNPNNTLPSDQSGAIKARIIESMQSLQDNFGYNDIQMVKGQAGDRKLENDLKLGGFQNNNETTYLGEDWETKKERIRKESPFGHYENWELCSVISKTGDDLRQEAFACQLIQAMSQVWKHEQIGVWVKKMRILITSANTGLVETITNALSVHSIKKALTKITIEEGSNPKGTIESLSLHFKKVFGDDENSIKYRNAQNNFAASLASYSLICYLLQIKDRHNGNIMLDNEGHIIHIDFGFFLSNSPGSVGFEAAPFKLTLEYIEILGGLEGEYYLKFKSLLKKAFLSIRHHAEHIIQMVDLMQRDSNLPCFKAGDQTANQLRQRFQLHLSDKECEEFVENFLIQKSNGSLYTRLYDQFQLLTQGIYS